MKREGLGRFVDETVALHVRAVRGLRVDVVHALRVAIRRCRSLAQGLREIDDDEGAARWKAFSDAGRPLFQGLGELRDAQVMREHTAKLLADDPAQGQVLATIDTRIRVLKEGARAAVVAFDAAAWGRAAHGLPERADALLVERPLFDHLSLRRFYEARELHQQAMRSRSSTALHALRIGVKKLRYSVENFLPEAHAAVGKPLKKMQEVLGDIHDLDVLVAMIASEHMRLHSDDRSRLASAVRAVRDHRIVAYRDMVVGADGVWPRIRRALVDGPAVARAHEALMMRKAHAHGVIPARARSIARGAHVLVYAFRDRARGLRDVRVPALLRFASVCGGVDGGGGDARRFVESLPVAVGFPERDRALLAVVARAVLGRAATVDDPRVAALLERDREVALALGAVVHLAGALRDTGPFTVRRGPDVAVVQTGRGVDDLARFVQCRAPLEALVNMPLWWKQGPGPSAGEVRPKRKPHNANVRSAPIRRVATSVGPSVIESGQSAAQIRAADAPQAQSNPGRMGSHPRSARG